MPKKSEVISNITKANQLTMAEIAYPDEKELIELIDNVINQEENNITTHRILDQNTVQESFKEFAAKQAKPSLRSLLAMFEPVLERENYIQLTLNSQQDELIEPVKIDLLKFIKKYFSNNEIEVNFTIDNSVEFKKVAYTDKEKLGELMNENEMVKLLVERLKLKTDY